MRPRFGALHAWGVTLMQAGGLIAVLVGLIRADHPAWWVFMAGSGMVVVSDLRWRLASRHEKARR